MLCEFMDDLDDEIEKFERNIYITDDKIEALKRILSQLKNLYSEEN